MEYARRLAQHGVPVHGLVRGYRVGQRRMNELVFAEVQATDMEPMVRVAVLEKDVGDHVRLHRLDVTASRRGVRGGARTLAGESEQPSRVACARDSGRQDTC